MSFSDKSCTTCLLISKSFKELFFTAFFRKADAKVRQISEPPKLFEEKFSESFHHTVFITFSLRQYVNFIPFSRESGCKITALQHIRQIFAPSFLHFFYAFYVKSLICKEVVRLVFEGGFEAASKLYLIIIIYARIR